MEKYFGQTIQVATALNKGIINDHFDVIPAVGIEDKARKYSGFLLRDFNIAEGPVQCSELKQKNGRDYQNIEDKFTNLPLEEALAKAREIVNEERVVLYLEREDAKTFPSPCHREIVWHPKGWEPNEG